MSSRGSHVKKKLSLGIAAGVAVLSMLVPMSSNAAPKLGPQCVVVNGPHGFHLQIGYSPTGPSGCRQV